MTVREAVRRLLGRDRVLAGFTGRLETDEHVLASAASPAGDPVVATSRGLWVPEPDGPRRVGWHLISKATWRDGAIALVEATEVADVGGAVLIADRPPRALRLVEPGRLPQVVHERVTGSIRSRHHRELPGADRGRADPSGPAGGGRTGGSGPPPGGAWFVQRKVPGRDGTVLQVRADPGTDEAAVRQVAADVARSLGLAP